MKKMYLNKIKIIQGYKVINNYKVLKRIGEGAFGKVKLVYNMLD